MVVDGEAGSGSALLASRSVSQPRKQIGGSDRYLFQVTLLVCD